MQQLKNVLLIELPRISRQLNSYSCWLLQKALDPPDDLSDAAFLFKDALHQLLRRQVGDVLLPSRILEVEVHRDEATVAVVLEDVFSLDLPCPVILFTL